MIKKLILSLGLFATLSFGATMEESSKMALDILEKLANNGNVEVQNKLGLMYTNGEGVRQDKKIAKEWFLRACDGGLQNACDNYKKLNEQGIDMEWINLKWFLLFFIGISFFFLCSNKTDKNETDKSKKDKALVGASITILLGIIGGIASNLFTKDSLISILALIVCAIMVFFIIKTKGEK